MSYLTDLHGEQSEDFIKGFLAAMDTYSVWKDGKRWIGSPEVVLGEAMREAVRDLYHRPEEFNAVIRRYTNT